MDHRFKQGHVAAIQPMLVIAGRVVTTTSGTVGSYDVRGGGCTVTKTATETGRYTITLTDAGDTALTDLCFLHASATIVAADDAALTTTKGIHAVIRDIDIGEGADNGTVEIQFVETVTANADTDIEDAMSFTFMLVLGLKAGAT